MVSKKKLLSVLLAAVLGYGGYTLANLEPDCDTDWHGIINSEFAAKVKTDMQEAKDNGCEVLKVELSSPGGNVFSVMESLEHLRNRPLPVAIHGYGIIASGATWVIGFGTPGMRSVSRNTIVLVHGLQQSSFFETKCLDRTENPETEDQKLNNALIELFAEAYAEASGYSFNTTVNWLKCGNEQAGNGTVLKKLNLVDKVD